MMLAPITGAIALALVLSACAATPPRRHVAARKHSDRSESRAIRAAALDPRTVACLANPKCRERLVQHHGDDQ